MFHSNLSDYNNKVASHGREFRRRKLINSTWAYAAKVLIKVQDNGDKEEIKHLIQLISKFPNYLY